MVLKVRHLSGSAFCTGFSRLKVPEQALDGILLGLGMVVKRNLMNFHVLVVHLYSARLWTVASLC